MTRPLALPPDQLQAVAAGQLDQGLLALGLKSAGLDQGPDLVAALAAELCDQARTAAAQNLQQDRLDNAGLPRYHLPWISGGIDLAGLYQLAAALRDQKAA